MTVYVIPVENSQGLTTGDPAHVAGDGEAPLVSSPISQKTEIQLYPVTIKIKRQFTGEMPTPPVRSGSQLQGFSDKSRGRLRFTATNSRDLLQSQFGLTYHNEWPTDGREFKRHLNLFLTRCRQAFPFLSYLWIAEFQSRGAPHVHLFLDLPANADHRATFARIWCSIVDPTGADASLYAFHDHPSNFITWTMGTGAYLCKYLDKAAQKAIPQGFTSFGRWWGNSRSLVPPPEIITQAEIDADLPSIDETTGEMFDQQSWAFLVRTVGRYHEKNNRRSWFRKTNRSTSCLTGAPIFRQALLYLRKTRGVTEEKTPF